ncbi:MAG: AmmeMemoRadiSam system radical SAM enzyme [Gordonibacter sp.]|nr:AmmeMemoRadiSam system radical SAM enzyme [Gordonibacter sp.]
MTEDATGTVCGVCPHACLLTEGKRGFCGARRAHGGQIVDENYGRVTSLALDPIEKKPLARFRSGSLVLSVGSYGCNLRCPFCQNASIACAGPGEVPWRTMAPEEVVRLAEEAMPRGNVGIAYTYNEPLIGYEFVLDTARLARTRGLVNVLVSNGMVNPGPLSELVPYIDAANIDLKGFTQEFYDEVAGSLATVKRTIETLAASPTCHLEVTTLVIPGLNDDAYTIDAAAAWLASLDRSIPYHLTRFFPCYRMQDRPPTPVTKLRTLAVVARRHLDDVLLGNC